MKNSLLRPQNKIKRLQWAKNHSSWTSREWTKVLWSDESKFQIFGSRRRVFVRRRQGERANMECIVPTVKHGGDSVMVWGCFGNNTTGDLKLIEGVLNKEGFNQILEENALLCPLWAALSGEILSSMMIMIQNIHQNCVENIWSQGVLSQMKFPDLNPIELLWNKLYRKVRESKTTSKIHLWELLQKSWNEISQEILIKLTERMPCLCRAVIKAKGGFFEGNKI
ncbi:hypothetical protein DMENIID0001_075710 [Sergentomyia squamirostris]